MKKHLVTAGLGSYYSRGNTAFDELPFIYKNINDLKSSLVKKKWLASETILDENATKDRIFQYLMEKVLKCDKEDWLLFYFTGHGAQASVSPVLRKMFCVTQSDELSTVYIPYLTSFFSVVDYAKVVDAFAKRCPGGHLITILDCCYSFGLIDEFSLNRDFHTVIAASAADLPAYYWENSFFFQSLAMLLEDSFNDIATKLGPLMSGLNSSSMCSIKLADKFKSLTLNY